MKPFPHHYRVTAAAGPEGEVLLSAEGVESLRSVAPAEFDGPGDHWSPEGLLVGAVSDCFILTFRAVARAARLPWLGLEVETLGTLDRAGGVTRFSRFDVRARLQVPAGTDLEMAERALHKAEAGCLVSNSLSAERHLAASVEVGG